MRSFEGQSACTVEVEVTRNDAAIGPQIRVRDGCAPWKDGAFQWVQVPPSDRCYQQWELHLKPAV